VAKKRGHMQAGGVPNLEESARTVIRDYMNGKLRFFTKPPTEENLYGSEDEDVEMKWVYFLTNN